jgi:hypothetical protein
MTRNANYQKFRESATQDLVRIWNQSFATPLENVAKGVQRYGAKNIRLWHQDDNVAAAFSALPMEQF